MDKLAVGKQTGGFMQTRSGTRPYRIETLLSKDDSKRPSDFMDSSKPTPEQQFSESLAGDVSEEFDKTSSANPQRAIKEIPSVPERGSNEQWTVSLSKHPAAKRGDHFDLRLVDQQGNAHSWALNKLPASGQNTYAIQQPTHSKKYALKDKPFSIPLNSYGGTRPGAQVEPVYVQPTEVMSSSNDHVHFSRQDGKSTQEFVLKRMGKPMPESSKPPVWMLKKKAAPLYHYGPKEVDLAAEGMKTPATLGDEAAEKYRGRAESDLGRKATREDIINWLEKTRGPGGSRMMSVLHRPIGEHSSQEQRDYAVRKQLYEVDYDRARKAGLIDSSHVVEESPRSQRAVRRRELVQALHEAKGFKPDERKLIFQGVPHGFIAVKGGTLPGEYLKKTGSDDADLKKRIMRHMRSTGESVGSAVKSMHRSADPENIAYMVSSTRHGKAFAPLTDIKPVGKSIGRVRRAYHRLIGREK